MLTQPFDKILIVDDEPDIALALKDFLDTEGYDASIASSGSAALAMLEKEKEYSVVLLDINMPGLDGVTVLKRLQDDGSNAAVIMMSGYGSEDIAVECMRKGAEDYISKPFSLNDIQQRISMARTHRRERIEKQQLQQEKEDFILMLSHDMKNPLTAVIGSIDIIREGCLGSVNEEQGEYLQSAIDSCNEVVTMIDNLLDIRRFEAGKLQMTINPHSVRELINKGTEQFIRQARHDGIELSITVESVSSEVSVDRNVFARVLGNLLVNALKLSPEGGTIAVSCRDIAENEVGALIPTYVQVPPVFRRGDRFVKLTVRDSGNGIPTDELGFLFDRYSRLSRKSGRERGGAGLGLAYCKLAIERFNGMIWAESEEGQGSTFVILLPCTM